MELDRVERSSDDHNNKHQIGGFPLAKEQAVLVRPDQMVKPEEDER